MTTDSAPTARTRDDFVTYDSLEGPDLDPALWSPLRLPRPTGGDFVPLDAAADVTVGDGEVRVTIPHFSLAHDTWQSGDSAKYVMYSTGEFELPADGDATFAVDLAVENLGGEPGDYRRGMAAFHVFAMEDSRPVFAVVGTSSRVLAMHEQLAPWESAEPFNHLVESPYEDFDDDFTRLRECEVTLDRSTSCATWRVDGRTIYRAPGALIPKRVRLGIGIWTMLPIRGGRSRSLQGQGIDARWHRFRARGIVA